MAMTVGELIEELMPLHPETPVILQKDAEGNGYSPLAGYEGGWYEADSAWSGEFIGDQNYEDEPEEYDVDETPRAVVLFPVN